MHMISVPNAVRLRSREFSSGITLIICSEYVPTVFTTNTMLIIPAKHMAQCITYISISCLAVSSWELDVNIVHITAANKESVIANGIISFILLTSFDFRFLWGNAVANS